MGTEDVLLDIQGRHLRAVRVLGRGGMGVVYEAEDVRLGRRVAVKVVRPELLASAEAVDRFLAEAGAAARVEHPNVVRVYGVHEHDGAYAIEMEYIAGSTLQKLMISGPLPPPLAARLLGELLSGLQACHEAGLVHCDLKPGNVIIDRRGGAHITDFGIARAVGRATGPTPPDSEDVVWGTPHYAAPEALEGGAPTPLWDLYAAGILTEEVLRGVRADATGALRPLDWPELSPAFASLVASLRCEDPTQRPISAAEALRLLRFAPEFHAQEEETGPLPVMTSSPATTSVHMSDAPVLPNRVLGFRRLGVSIATAAVLCIALLSVVYAMARGDNKNAAWPAARPDAVEAAPPTVPDFKRREATELVHASGVLYFNYDDGQHGRELWTLSGNSLTLIADLNPGPVGSNPTNLTSARGGLFFSAERSSAGREPWFCTSVGSQQYTVASLGDLNPGPMGSNPWPFHVHENLILFYACTHRQGWEPWCSLGDARQTALIADLNPGIDYSLPMGLRVCPDDQGGYLVAITNAEPGMTLVRYTYETNSCTPVARVSTDTASMAILDGQLYLMNEDIEHGREPWCFDEATRSLALLRDANPGPDSSDPSEFFAWDEHVLFQAVAAGLGEELWITDGTSDGTRLLKDIDPGPGNGDPYCFTISGGRVYFRATTAASGQELWCTDGTPEGTVQVADIWPGPESAVPYTLRACGDRLFFTANDGVHGEELWMARWDGTAYSVRLVADIWPGQTGAEPRDLCWTSVNTGALAVDLPPGKPGLALLTVSADDAVISTIDLDAGAAAAKEAS